MNQPLSGKSGAVQFNLLEWLREHSLQQGTQMVSLPMLLIDDEADHASINTGYSRDEITRINSQIRELLSLFQRSCYVGYTATPFANIFIDPDSEDEVLKQDLFPRHFIIGLDAPSNYFGAQKVFLDDRDQHVREIMDNEDVLPIRHKIDHPTDVLPASLRDAVRAFIIARAIRNERGQQGEHASMLVNVSRFTDVQGRLRNLVADLVGDIRAAVTVDAGKGRAAMRNPEIAALHEVWQREYDTAEPDWPKVQARLYEVLAGMTVIEVNASRRAQRLDYDQGGEHGQTVIAIGGYSLSRGLTLEGLTISYFLRNSQMYDTLMQMGRWFGYRPRYEDLCRIWIPASGAGWYAHIHEAVEDLQAQLKRMELAKATPEDFGLAVRSHPESLMVTARNKMGSGKFLPMKVGLAESLIETTRIAVDPALLARNMKAGESLIEGVRLAGIPLEERPRGHLVRNVPVVMIDDFLGTFRTDRYVPPADPLTDPTLIRDYIRARADGELGEWDIFIASSTRKEQQAVSFAFLSLVPAERSVDPDDFAHQVFSISGSSRRIGSSEDEREGLSQEQIDTALEGYRQSRSDKTLPKTISPRVYRTVPGRRPLLILRLVQPRVDDGKGHVHHHESILTWGISFPSSAVSGGTVEYLVNTVRMRELFGEEEIEEEALGDAD